jgi:hypothetical protein
MLVFAGLHDPTVAGVVSRRSNGAKRVAIFARADPVDRFTH